MKNAVCEVCKSSIDVFFSSKFQKYLCSKHWSQLNRHGKILPFTWRDLNEIKDCGKYCEVILLNRKHNEIGRTKIDKENISIILPYRWHLCNGYARTTKTNNPPALAMHRIIIHAEPGQEVDHINGDRLDNRKSNLRICNHKENMHNVKKLCTNTSGYKGVSWNKSRKKWIAQIVANGKQIYLGQFSNIEDAYKTRMLAEKHLFGEFTYKEDKKYC